MFFSKQTLYFLDLPTAAALQWSVGNFVGTNQYLFSMNLSDWDEGWNQISHWTTSRLETIGTFTVAKKDIPPCNISNIEIG